MMDKIKITEMTHLMGRIKALMDDDGIICATINNDLYGETYLHLFNDLFKQIFNRYETSRFDDTTDVLSTEINGIKVFCLVDKYDRTTD